MVTGISAHHNTDPTTIRELLWWLATLTSCLSLIVHRCASVNRTCSHLCNPESDECSCPQFSQLDSDKKTCLPISELWLSHVTVHVFSLRLY